MCGAKKMTMRNDRLLLTAERVDAFCFEFPVKNMMEDKFDLTAE